MHYQSPFQQSFEFHEDLRSGNWVEKCVVVGLGKWIFLNMNANFCIKDSYSKFCITWKFSLLRDKMKFTHSHRYCRWRSVSNYVALSYSFYYRINSMNIYGNLIHGSALLSEAFSQAWSNTIIICHFFMQVSMVLTIPSILQKSVIIKLTHCESLVCRKHDDVQFPSLWKWETLCEQSKWGLT